MIPTIAHREFTERIRSKLFLGINAFLIVVIVAAIVVPTLMDADREVMVVGVTGPDGAAVVAAAAAQAGPDGQGYEAVEVADRAAGEAALREGDLDVLLDGASTLVTETGVGMGTEAVFASAAQSVLVDAELDEAGVSPERRAQLLGSPALNVEVLDDDVMPMFGAAMFTVLIAVALLYGLLIFHGQWLAQGIVEEKQSRVIEVLLSAVRPWQLLAGKIAGIGLLGLAQVALLVGVALTAMYAVDLADIPVEARGAIALVVVWYLAGYTVYATLFAVAGTLAARSEDLQATTTPVFVLLIAAMLIAQAATAAPRTTLAAVSAYVPFTAPMVQPVRVAAGVSSFLEVAGGIVLTLGTIVALVPLSGRLYRGGALRTRSRIGIREAWSSSDR